MSTRACLALFLVVLVPWAGGNAGGAQTRRPNILVIVADDMGYADIGVHGSRDIRTPNIDRLAGEGVRFTDAYVSGPYCSPTRAGLLTGRYPQRFGHEFNIEPGHETAGLPLGERTIADRLKASGYRTAVFGKWHLGMSEAHHPLRRGFEEFFGFLAGQHSYVNVGTGGNRILDGTTPVTSIDYLTDALADRAAAYIKQHAAEPMDDGIGKTLAALREHKLDQDTLVIFFNDNGGPTMSSTTVNGSSNGPLRGSKRTTWEDGIRVPFIIRWTDHLPAGRIDRRPIIQLDVLPTALAAAGVAAGDTAALDGVNLLPFLTRNANGSPHDALYWRLGGMMAIRRSEWKLVKSRMGLFVDSDPAVLSDLAGADLFNLIDDIGETKNLAAAHPDKVKELSDNWQRWNKQPAKPLWDPPSRGRGRR